MEQYWEHSPEPDQAGGVLLDSGKELSGGMDGGLCAPPPKKQISGLSAVSTFTSDSGHSQSGHAAASQVCFGGTLV